MNGPHIIEVPVTVVVSGGVGTATFKETGEMNDIFIHCPNGATYDWSIVNGHGVPRAGEGGVSGDRSVDTARRTCIQTNTISISNATNGTYAITIHINRGYSSGL